MSATMAANPQGSPTLATTGPATARWQALGSTVVLRAAEPSRLEPAVEAVRDVLARIDAACSRFRSDSELSRLNDAGGRPVAVGPLLLAEIALALRAAELTDGAVDPCVGAALERAGYDRDWQLIAADGDAPGEIPAVTARRRADWQAVEIDRVNGRARVPAGVRLDLGATAKAHAADLACAAAHERVGGGVLVALGGDVATCGEPPAGGWEVHVTDDHRDGPDAPGQRVWVASGGLATSSVAVRRWRRGGREMHHIIDPATERPALTPWRTVSVAAADCADANIASTAALVRGEDAPRWLAERGLPARLVALDGRVQRVAQWPAGGETAPLVVGEPSWT